MKKKFFSREVKVGLMAIGALFVLYFGLNFLKGVNIFSPISYYYASYQNLDGLIKSSPVYVKGYKVGQVEEIKYDFSKVESFVIKVGIERDIQLPIGARMELFDDGLMGGKAVQLVYEPIVSSQKMYASGDTLASNIARGLMSQLSGTLLPKIESISIQTDSLIRSVRKLVGSKEINKSLKSIESTTSDLAVSSAQLKKMINNDMPKLMNNVNLITSDFSKISGNLKSIDFAATFASINHTIANLNLVTDKMNSTEGTIGLLLNDKDLYIHLSNTAANADKLVLDLKENPKRYVHFSVFGRKSK